MSSDESTGPIPDTFGWFPPEPGEPPEPVEEGFGGDAEEEEEDRTAEELAEFLEHFREEFERLVPLIEAAIPRCEPRDVASTKEGDGLFVLAVGPGLVPIVEIEGEFQFDGWDDLTELTVTIGNWFVWRLFSEALAVPVPVTVEIFAVGSEGIGEPCSGFLMDPALHVRVATVRTDIPPGATTRDPIVLAVRPSAGRSTAPWRGLVVRVTFPGWFLPIAISYRVDVE